MSDKTERSRRALLTGGAVLLGGAVLANEGTADAADGKSLLMGRTNNTASHTTKLTMSGNAQALNVTNSNSGTKAHAIVGDTKNGYGVVGESTKNDGGMFRTHSGGRWGAVAQNLGPFPNNGGALLAQGGHAMAISATTTNPGLPAIVAYNEG